ncbi:TPA: type VI secretion system ATPase TssH [Pseudomonas aeruginosa]|uniref:type VI secretion system ATPase TssH n=2 Tax=Pseudomonas aeruginosa TaxID=287 RepID=UPI001902E294|nr:type VI secretion system ATPase TssH [Pseudomonas aeruginosa]MDI2461433.1 type VI secretion system ATPase TssH [Pseudomonas aeruginosa]QQM10908.1 type VI secretion system ATPase TssH [Pseudomonas aeruginosa]HBO4313773.1 type VI secretion system ATPase TssH [Pseudomonas aeruginosa]HBO4704080.1 type VI secretion system ATPase TssH [Pseudomonas aeruginosa]HCF4400129.1 type VI secretion system ATPase TssH [Pseudomonas aeruginosa]
MITVDLAALFERLSPFCRQAMEEAGSLCIGQRGAEVTVAHLLTAFLEQPVCDVRVTLADAGLSVDAVRHALSSAFADRDAGNSQYPSLSPLLVEVLQEAWLLSSVELGQPHIRSGAILLATLLNPARYLPLAAIQLFDGVNREALRKRFSVLLSASAEALEASTDSEASADKLGEDSALARFGHDFTAQARDGRIDPVLCRDAEIDLMVDILSRRRKNNPIVVGDAGVGKSAVVEGLALRIVQGRVPEPLRMVELWGLDLGALQAGASVKGEFEKRLKAVIDEVKGSSRPIILFIDEAHTLIGAGNTAGGSDAANLLKPALARGELRTIAATTWSEYKKYFEKDPALTRRFQLVKLEEPTPEQAVHILRGLRPIYEASHQVFIGDDALQASATLAGRYLSGRQLPDKAIDVLDTACARVASALAEPPRRLSAMENELNQIDAESAQVARDGRAGRAVAPGRLEALATARKDIEQSVVELRQAWERQKALVDEIVALRARDDVEGLSQVLAGKVAQLSELQRAGALLHADVGAEQIAQVIADWTGIPATTISSDQMARLDSLPGNLKGRVKGQDAALDVVYRRLLTALADLRRPGTPMGAFLLVGPSGVGKTETALAVADSLFGGEQFLTTINMSEYQEKFTVSRLLGAPPGYVGYGEGGVLTEAIRKQPYSVVLLDEVEKAHPEVLNVFYQAFDKGELADGEGRRIDCQNVLFFLTSNLGFDEGDNSLTDLDGDALRQRLMRFFKPALLARMQIVPYRYLDEEVLNEIIDSRLQRLRQQFRQRYDATLVVVDAARDELRARCARHQNGARMLDASIDGELLPPLSLAVLQRLSRGDKIQRAQVGWCDGKFAATLD